MCIGSDLYAETRIRTKRQSDKNAVIGASDVMFLCLEDLRIIAIKNLDNPKTFVSPRVAPMMA